jgi:hypothetical protein
MEESLPSSGPTQRGRLNEIKNSGAMIRRETVSLFGIFIDIL